MDTKIYTTPLDFFQKVVPIEIKIGPAYKKFKFMTEFDKGYNEGYNSALIFIKSEIEKRLSDKESILKQFSEEDYVSSVAATQYNIKVGLVVARIVIDKEIERVSDLL